jgi:hypothetical protein
METGPVSELHIFTTKEAAVYLGMTERAVNYHLFVVHDLRPDRIMGRVAIYSQETLDDFNKRRRKPGRPCQQPTEDAG